MLLASISRENDVGPHGMLMSEATDDHTEFLASDLPTVDKAARAIGEAQERYYKRYPDTSRAGHIWRVKKVGD